MVYIDWQYLKKASLASGGYCICSVIGVSPSIGAIRKTAISEVIYDTLVGVFLRAHENQAAMLCQDKYHETGMADDVLFQGMGTASVVED